MAAVPTVLITEGNYLTTPLLLIKKYLEGFVNMKRLNTFLIALFILLFAFSGSVIAKSTSSGSGTHSVKGHVKKDGTYVQPHHATNPNNTQRDNWSSKPNVNPYSGKPGTKEAEK